MNLKTLARPFRKGAVVLYMMPYRTLQVDIAVDELAKRHPNFDSWHNVQKCFALCVPLVVDIEFGDPLSTEEKGLQAYWLNRNGDYAANYDLFAQLLSSDLCNVFWEAYSATRDNSIEAPPELQPEAGESADPESDAATISP
jgi:hypothetical protein